MSVYLISDLYRIDGATGKFVESEYADDSMKLQAWAPVSARNQYVSFQIVCAPESGKAKDLKVSFSDLSGAGTIPAGNFDAFVEWFHHVEDVVVPDLLIPLAEYKKPVSIPMDETYLADQTVGAFWVDLFVPADTAPGSYQGTVTVSVDGEETLFPVNLTVKSAVVPATRKITADCNNYADSISWQFDSLKDNPDRYHDGSYFKVEHDYYRLAREHRALFHNLPYKHSGNIPESFIPTLAGEGKDIHVESWDLFDEHFGPLLDGTAFKGSRVSEEPVEFMYLPFNLGWPASYEKWGKKGYKTEYRRIMQEFVRHFEEKGWDKTYMDMILNNKKDYRFYPYTIDEIWYKHDEDVVDVYYDIIRDIIEYSSAKFIWRMDSSNYYHEHFDHRFSDMCKMWVAGNSMLNWCPESVEIMKNKGNILWTYGSVLRSLKAPLHSVFVWPMQCVITGVEGFCIWNTTGVGKDYLNAPANLGGETLFYPGSYFGIEAPLPTVRLKALRNAMQTAELCMLAKGTPAMGKVNRIINRAFGFKSSADWWVEKPPFIDTPPRYWDFGPAFGKYCMPPLYLGRSPEIARTVEQDVIALLSGEDEAERARVHFQFQ